MKALSLILHDSSFILAFQRRRVNSNVRHLLLRIDADCYHCDHKIEELVLTSGQILNCDPAHHDGEMI